MDQGQKTASINYEIPRNLNNGKDYEILVSVDLKRKGDGLDQSKYIENRSLLLTEFHARRPCVRT